MTKRTVTFTQESFMPAATGTPHGGVVVYDPDVPLRGKSFKWIVWAPGRPQKVTITYDDGVPSRKSSKPRRKGKGGES